MPGRNNRRGAGSMRPSPLNRALEPGSQDDLRGTPLPPSDSPSPYAAADDDELHHHQQYSISNSSKKTTAETCGGPYSGEHFATFHQDPAAVAKHIKEFIYFNGATSFVNRYGVDLVNWAIEEINKRRMDLRNPAGFLRHLVREEAEDQDNRPSE